MEWVKRKQSRWSGCGIFGYWDVFFNTRWARVSSIVEAGLEDSEEEMDCDKY